MAAHQPFSAEYKNQCIKSYCVAGFTLFPCKVVNGKKVPKFNGWQGTQFDPFLSAEDLPEIFGVLLPENIAVLDYDPRRNQPGQNQLEDLWKALQLPVPFQTFIVASGRGDGGLHIYFKVPKGVNLRARVPGFDAIEIKAHGKYVVGAGAKHPNGGSYAIVRGKPREIAEMPRPMFELCEAPAALEGISVETDDEDTQRIYIGYLLNAPPAIEGANGSDTTFTTAAQGKDYGLSEEVTYELMLKHFNSRCLPPWTATDLRTHVANAYKYSQNTSGSKNALAQFAHLEDEYKAAHPAQPAATGEQLKIRWDKHWQTVNGEQVEVLEGTLVNAINWFMLPSTGMYANPLHNLIRLNVFNNRIEFMRPAPWHKPGTDHFYWDDTDDINLKHFLLTGDNYKHGALQSIATTTCREAAFKVAYDNQYHPIKDWGSKLEWDGIARLDKWLTTYCGVADSPYAREVAKDTLIAAWARVYQPGCKHDWMLVLEGPQNLGKSMVIAILGGQWAANVKIAVDSAGDELRTVHAMMRGWILEAGEMAFTRKSEIESIKNFVSRQVDVVRLPYARDTVDVPRRSIWVGSVNPDGSGYLRDATGNRRFMPVLATKIDLDALANDRDQLFAEALTRYKRGEQWWITDKAILQEASAEQAKRLEMDPLVEAIENFLSGVCASESFQEILTTDTISKYALNRMSPTATERRQIGNVMVRFGYELKRRRHDGKQLWSWEQTDTLKRI